VGPGRHTWQAVQGPQVAENAGKHWQFSGRLHILITMKEADRQAGPGDIATSGEALARLGAALGAVRPGKGPPPVESWNPPFCGEIDMRIDADGIWFYNGTPIGRPGLVKLFASVLRKDPERYVLVTPVERVGIAVADVPFMAVEMALEGEADARKIAFRTNVDDLVEIGAEHPLRFDKDEAGGVKPYLRVRGGLWARVTRALTYDLIDLGEERHVDGVATFGVAAGGQFYPIAPADGSFESARA
jgi:hypothetical protein